MKRANYKPGLSEEELRWGIAIELITQPRVENSETSESDSSEDFEQ